MIDKSNKSDSRPPAVRNPIRSMSQDHTGYTWSMLEDAPDPSIIVPGALILAGEEGDPDDPVAVCRVVELEEINNHMVVRFEILVRMRVSWLQRAD